MVFDQPVNNNSALLVNPSLPELFWVLDSDDPQTIIFLLSWRSKPRLVGLAAM